MLPALFITITYLAATVFGYVQTLRLRKHLENNNAITPEAAIFVDRQKFLVVTTLFFFSAILETEDGRLWLMRERWRTMITIFGMISAITLLSLIGLILLYL